MRKRRHIFCRRKKPRVSRHSTHNAGVFVLHFSLDDALTKALIVLGGRNGFSPLLRRDKACAAHGEWAENFPLAEPVEWFVGDASQRFAKNQKANIAVLG